MKIRHIVLTSAWALSVPAAFAAGGSTWVGGEIGFVDHPIVSSKTRQQVREEFLAFRANPVLADGTRVVGGEAGYALPQHSYAWQGGRFVHTDTLAHNTPRPSLSMSEAEKRLRGELYVN